MAENNFTKLVLIFVLLFVIEFMSICMAVLFVTHVTVTISPNIFGNSKPQDTSDCRWKKNRAHHKYKKNIAMTDCLQAG